MYCGSSDVFSYPEDESVLDPQLAQHLAFFGIDFSSLQKVSYSSSRDTFAHTIKIYVEDLISIKV